MISRKDAVHITGRWVSAQVGEHATYELPCRKICTKTRSKTLQLIPSEDIYSTESIYLPLKNRDFPAFSLEIKIGTSVAEQQQFLYFDTGSSLVWLQCVPSDYAPDNFPVYNPSGSETYDPVLPTDPLCKGIFVPNFGDNTCEYAMNCDDTNTTGVFAQEMFTFPNIVPQEPDSLYVETMLYFGCSHSTVSSSKDFKRGVLGMGNREESLAMQLLTEDEFEGFSYCLALSKTRKSSVTFGDDLELMGGQRTPLMRKMTSVENKYYIELQDMGVNDNRLGIDGARVFARHPDGIGGGCFVDSTATASRIIEEAFDMIKHALDIILLEWVDEKEGYEQANEDPRLRYKVRANSKLSSTFEELPTITYFLRGAELKVGGQKLYSQKTDKTDNLQYLYLSIQPSDKYTIIGTMHQMDTRFSFNLAKQMVAFAPEICA